MFNTYTLTNTLSTRYSAEAVNDFISKMKDILINSGYFTLDSFNAGSVNTSAVAVLNIVNSNMKIKLSCQQPTSISTTVNEITAELLDENYTRLSTGNAFKFNAGTPNVLILYEFLNSVAYVLYAQRTAIYIILICATNLYNIAGLGIDASSAMAYYYQGVKYYPYPSNAGLKTTDNRFILIPVYFGINADNIDLNATPRGTVYWKPSTITTTLSIFKDENNIRYAVARDFLIKE